VETLPHDAVCDRAQDIFKQALQTPRVELRVIFADVQRPPPLPAHPPPALYRPVAWRKPLPDLPSTADVDGLLSCEPNTSTPCKDDECPQPPPPPLPPQPTPSTVTKQQPPSTTSKAAGPISAMKTTHPLVTPSRSARKTTAAAPRTDSKSNLTPFYSTRTVGRKLHIQLVKGKSSRSLLANFDSTV